MFPKRLAKSDSSFGTSAFLLTCIVWISMCWSRLLRSYLALATSSLKFRIDSGYNTAPTQVFPFRVAPAQARSSPRLNPNPCCFCKLVLGLGERAEYPPLAQPGGSSKSAIKRRRRDYGSHVTPNLNPAPSQILQATEQIRQLGLQIFASGGQIMARSCCSHEIVQAA